MFFSIIFLKILIIKIHYFIIKSVSKFIANINLVIGYGISTQLAPFFYDFIAKKDKVLKEKVRGFLEVQKNN